MLCDIDDESDRNSQERPFPFLPSMDPAEYLSRHLNNWSTPVVVYRAVGKYDEPQLGSWLDDQEPDRADTLDASLEQAMATALELIAFCRRLGVPFGLNVESVSNRRTEIESSVNLAARLQAELRRSD